MSRINFPDRSPPPASAQPAKQRKGDWLVSCDNCDRMAWVDSKKRPTICTHCGAAIVLAEKPKVPRVRKPLRRVSKKRAKLNRKVNPERESLKDFVGFCMVEGCYKDAVEVHEITRGFAREDALELPRLQMPVCRKHHKEFDDYSKWPPERQLTHRALWELRQMVTEFNEVRGRASSAFTVEELIGRLMFRKRRS